MTKITSKKNPKDIKTINDLFNKYLYFLRIYSPYVNIENKNFIKQKIEKEEEEEEIGGNTKENDAKESFNNIINIKTNINNNDSFIDDYSILNTKNDFPILDLNLSNNYSSRTFSRFFK